MWYTSGISSSKFLVYLSDIPSILIFRVQYRLDAYVHLKTHYEDYAMVMQIELSPRLHSIPSTKRSDSSNTRLDSQLEGNLRSESHTCYSIPST